MEKITGPADDPDDASLTPAEFCKAENIGKTTFYQEVNSGRLEAKKIGSRTVVLPAARRRWRDNLPDYVPTGAAGGEAQPANDATEARDAAVG